MLSQLLFYLALITGFIYLVIYNWRRRHHYIFSWKTPGPWAWPIIGNLLMLPKNKDEELLDFLHEYGKKYTDVFPVRFWLGNSLYLLVQKPEHMRAIFNSPHCYERNELHDRFVRAVHGYAIGSLPYDEWKRVRRLLNPSFNSMAVNQQLDLLNEYSDKFVELFKPLVNKKDIDVFTAIGDKYMDLMYEAALGIKIHATDAVPGLFNKIKRLYQISLERTAILPYHFDFIFYRSKLGKEHLSYIKELDELHYKLIAQKRKMMKDHKIDGKSNKYGYLDPIFTDDFSDKEIRDHLTNFAFAGSDTSVTSLCFFMLSMAMNPDIQAKVHEELDMIFGDDRERPVTLDDLSKLEYLEQCLKESLRMFVNAFGVSRLITQDIEIDGYKIPKGTHAFMTLYNLHYNPEFWPEPYKFIPERFTPEQIAKRDLYWYQSFTTGPRNCIGWKFGIISLKVELAHFMRSYRMKSNIYKKREDVKLGWKMNIYPLHGYNIEIEERS